MNKAILFVAASVLGLSPIEIKGQSFIHSDSGALFLPRGIKYQPNAAPNQYGDPLSNQQVCLRDAPILQQLGVNLIYVTNAAPQINGHGECMQVLQDAGIYVLLDLPSSNFNITDQYTSAVYRHYLEIADEFSRYNNTLGLMVASNVQPDYQPLVKAAIRDLRQNMNGRRLPLGYSHDDILTKKLSQVMMGCGEKADFFAVDISDNCEYSTLKEASMIGKHMKPFHGPTFFSGFGCKGLSHPRQFEEASVVFSNRSGGIFNDYSAQSSLSLVDIQGSEVILKEEYFNAQKAIFKPFDPKNITPDYIPYLYECAENSFVLPPTPDESLCTCALQNLQCVASDKAKLGYGTNETATLYQRLCQQGFCAEVKPNLKKNFYPKYSHCEFDVQLSIALNAAKLSGIPCHFGGLAAPAKISETSPACHLQERLSPETTADSSGKSLIKAGWAAAPLVLFVLI
ncbi:1,3-beta-glucanosyltransferase [Entomophthora muscae]|uniref:1,3-beta-glucanosyltransferase n=1 Tax=Entomophthora muscae TaxID=34485 RepID=A0ACC2UD72_9FUNG|nr:1,3-beta-glucanosyltransferase [Entomophthora muscae]